jgi:hypothetical protein
MGDGDIQKLRAALARRERGRGKRYTPNLKQRKRCANPTLQGGRAVTPPRGASGGGLRFTPSAKGVCGAEQDRAAEWPVANDELGVSDGQAIG